jgi:hypothetical protein
MEMNIGECELVDPGFLEGKPNEDEQQAATVPTPIHELFTSSAG